MTKYLSFQVETIAHPKERKHLLQQLDLKIVVLSIIAGVILLVILIIVLWCVSIGSERTK